MCIRGVNIIKMAVLFHMKYRFKAVFIKIPATFFFLSENDKVIQKLYVNSSCPESSKQS